MSSSALVVAAHPDDEVLGCGGFIAKMARSGWQVDILILAEGATSRDNERNRVAHAAELSLLGRAAQEAGKVLGVRAVELHSFADNRMDSITLLDVVKLVEATIARTRPQRVLTHCGGDVNIDHRVVHDAVVAATRPLPGAMVRELLFFETPSSTEWRPPTSLPMFAPAMYVDISDDLEMKLKALRAYVAEMREFPHPRSLEGVTHLARWRGATAGYAAAEAFEVGRILS